MAALEIELADVVFSKVLIEMPPTVYLPEQGEVAVGDPVELFELDTLDAMGRTGRRVFAQVIAIAPANDAGVAVTLGKLRAGERL